MSWEEYRRLTRILLAFYALEPMDRQTILLMMDGMKYREEKKRPGRERSEG